MVAGNGDPTTDRVLRRDAAPVTPAWRPHSDRVLTYATRAGAVETIDVETGRTLWTGRARLARAPLAGLGAASASSHSRHAPSRSWIGAVTHVRTIALPGVARALALHPSGRRAAVVVGSRVLGSRLAGGSPRQLFQGSVDGIAWSQDGRRLLLGWRDATSGSCSGPGGRIRALHGVSRELGAAGGFPRVAGWCCAG